MLRVLSRGPGGRVGVVVASCLRLPVPCCAPVQLNMLLVVFKGVTAPFEASEDFRLKTNVLWFGVLMADVLGVWRGRLGSLSQGEGSDGRDLG